MLEQSLNGKWQFRISGSDQWFPATVPGGVHTDLLAIDQIPDPFVSDNEKRVQWVAESDWEYHCTFTVQPTLLDKEHVFLVCDGLDTLAEVMLNGQRIANVANMFCQYRWEVMKLLQPGENELSIHFASPVRYAAEHDRLRRLPGVNEMTIPGNQYLRKAPCHFGWDWGPKLPPIGIWKDIRLEAGSLARLDDVHLRQTHANGQVSLSLQATPEIWIPSPLRLSLRVTSPNGEVFLSDESHTSDDPHSNTPHFLITLPIKDPQLWWPNGYGEQPLYQVEVQLWSGEQLLDQRKYHIGLRTLELHQEPDEWGSSFTFIVNGVPIFAKGANWIPADSFPTRISPQYLEHLIRSSAKANYNMLRVWGGGYYESEPFFDLCDRYGILIWHDFMFACAAYPLNDPDFVENIHPEVIQNVRRLRHRTCLALWCGNNEMESGWLHWGWSTPENANLKAADQVFFYKTLPDWVKAEDPEHSYWPSSPSSHTPHENPHSNATGDNHLWEVWHAMKPIRFYREQYPRFASEFGLQSLPALATIAAYAEPSEWNMTSYIMEHHQRHPRGNGKIISYMTDHYRLAKDFPSLVYLTQVLHAEAMRISVEHWRRNRARCSGALYWQINDCWPVASWSSIDSYGRWKALHYAARRFFAPLLLSVEDNGTRMGLFITSDQTDPWQGEVRWSLETFNGDQLDHHTLSVNAAPLATTFVTNLDFSDILDEAAQRCTVHVCELWKDGQRLAMNVTPLLPDKHLLLQNPQLTVNTKVEGGLLHAQLHASSLARFVELQIEDGSQYDFEHASFIFSDNYFDLPADRELSVTCPVPENWTPEQAQQALRVRTLWDSYT
jgi:beta-mannosidase